MKKPGINVAHEAPVSIMPIVQQVTDYDYALSVLFNKIPGYYDFFVEAKKKGRWVLLDNGIFEEGEPMEAGQYADWITKLYPDEYVVPDALEDADKTISNFDNWLKNYGDIPGRKIGVAQGKTLEEFIECYRYMSAKADKIAISFDYGLYVRELNTKLEGKTGKLNKFQKWAVGRPTLISHLFGLGILNTAKPHHLLGCSLSYEFAVYRNTAFSGCIESLDTSAPVVYGILKGKYPPNIGLQTEKVSTKLKELITTPRSDKLIADTVFNIAQFKLQNGL